MKGNYSPNIRAKKATHSQKHSSKRSSKEARNTFKRNKRGLFHKYQRWYPIAIRIDNIRPCYKGTL
jgi:hypothetical protein